PDRPRQPQGLSVLSPTQKSNAHCCLRRSLWWKEAVELTSNVVGVQNVLNRQIIGHCASRGMSSECSFMKASIASRASAVAGPLFCCRYITNCSTASCCLLDSADIFLSSS